MAWGSGKKAKEGVWVEGAANASCTVGGVPVRVAGEQNEGCLVGMRLDCWAYGIRKLAVTPAPSHPPLSGDY